MGKFRPRAGNNITRAKARYRKTFTFIRVPPMAVAVIAAVIVIAVIGVAVAGAAGVITPRKGSGKNPKKSSLWKKGGLPSGLPM